MVEGKGAMGNRGGGERERATQKGERQRNGNGKKRKDRTRDRNGDREKLTITLRGSADPRGQHCYLHYWYLEPPTLFPLCLSLIPSIYPPPPLRRSETLFSEWYFVRFHSCAPSQRSSKFSRAARTLQRAVPIFSPSVPRNRYHRARRTI